MNINPFNLLANAVEAAWWKGTNNFLRKLNSQIQEAGLGDGAAQVELLEVRVPELADQAAAAVESPRKGRRS